VYWRQLLDDKKEVHVLSFRRERTESFAFVLVTLVADLFNSQK
jgi:hypothetical protein